MQLGIIGYKKYTEEGSSKKCNGARNNIVNSYHEMRLRKMASACR